MKKLLFAIVILSGCVDNFNDTQSTITVERSYNRRDTITVSYYKQLKVWSDGLYDGNSNRVCDDVRSYSIISTEKIK